MKLSRVLLPVDWPLSVQGSDHMGAMCATSQSNPACSNEPWLPMTHTVCTLHCCKHLEGFRTSGRHQDSNADAADFCMPARIADLTRPVFAVLVLCFLLLRLVGWLVGGAVAVAVAAVYIAAMLLNHRKTPVFAVLVLCCLLLSLVAWLVVQVLLLLRQFTLLQCF